MVKHTQAILQQIADELFACVWPFYELALKGYCHLTENNEK